MIKIWAVNNVETNNKAPKVLHVQDIEDIDM